MYIMFIKDISSIRKIISHNNCADGTGSALLIKDVCPEAEVLFVQYGTESYLNLPVENGLIFCDISPPAESAHLFVQVGSYVLDHHRSAASVVSLFGDHGRFADENLHPGISGTMLAYSEIWKPSVADRDPEYSAFVEKFARLAGVRDTWQNSSPEWQDACIQSSLMNFMPNTEWIRIGLREIFNRWDSYWSIGKILMDKHLNSVQKAIKGGFNFVSDKGTRVLVFNSKSYTSDATEMLADKYDLIVGFGYSVEGGIGRIILSTRSYSNFDCSLFSRSIGGGGHTKAAGASLIVPSGENPYETIIRLLNKFEAS